MKLVALGECSEQDKAGASWPKVAKMVEDYSEDLIEQWNKEIDDLLTFVRSFQFHIGLPGVY